MPYCSNCGASLVGAKRFCSNCGFRVPAENGESPDRDLDRTGRVGVSADVEMVDPTKEEAYKPPPAPEEPEQEPPEYQKGEEPRRDRAFTPNCSDCGSSGTAVCHFCDKGLCDKHQKKMAIMVNNIASSRIIAACDACGKAKKGEVPTAPEAREAAFLYTVKPYHEWDFVE